MGTEIIVYQTGLNCHLMFLTSGHSDAYGWASQTYHHHHQWHF